MTRVRRVLHQQRKPAKGQLCYVLQLCPPSRERSLALTKIEEAIMHANAAIARNE